jgi:hypothetical protein
MQDEKLNKLIDRVINAIEDKSLSSCYGGSHSQQLQSFGGSEWAGRHTQQIPEPFIGSHDHRQPLRKAIEDLVNYIMENK